MGKMVGAVRQWLLSVWGSLGCLGRGLLVLALGTALIAGLTEGLGSAG